MQIKRLTIDNYKCLVDFEIDFDIKNGGSSTILIGQNGTGKSTMIDVMLQIMMSFDSPVVERNIEFNYEIEYLYAGQDVSIKKIRHYYDIVVSQGNSVIGTFSGAMSKIGRDLESEMQSIFPKRIMAFYSGSSNKLFLQIKRINTKYTTLLKKEVQNYLYYMSHQDEFLFPKETFFPKETLFLKVRRRKYNYCSDNLTSIFLISMLAGQDSFEKKYLIKLCKFSFVYNIDIQINIKKVRTFLSAYKMGDRFDKDAIIYIVEFIDNRFVESFEKGFQSIDKMQAFFTIDNIHELDLDTTSIYEFLEKLSTLVSAEYEVYIAYGENRVKVNDLSEGQRQLIKILGMLSVCKGEDCLVLMDEPDVHMNPRWKYELKATIDKVLETATNTQAIIATHDPLVINGVDKEFIRIFAYNQEVIKKSNKYVTQVHIPTEDTKGMGIDGLLQSEYYGLKTSYDAETSKQYNDRQELYIKLINNEITAKEKEKLKKITKELSSLPISYNTIDFFYDDFISAFRNTEFYKKEYLTYDEIHERRTKIKDIISTLYEAQE